MLEQQSIYHFSSYQDFLTYKFKSEMYSATGRKKKNLDSLAKSLGYRSASILSLLMNGHRIPSSEMLAKLSDHWRLSSGEREYLRLLIQLKRYTANGKDVYPLQQKLARFASKVPQQTITMQKFNAACEWYYLVVKLLVSCSVFKEDPVWISRKLKKKISPTEAKKAIDDLLAIGIIYRDPVSKKLRANGGITETSHEIPSTAIQNFHRGMIMRALESIEQQTIQERQINALSLKFDPKKLSLAKERILQFIKDFNEEFESAEANTLYQLNTQFFELTEKDVEYAIQ